MIDVDRQWLGQLVSQLSLGEKELVLTGKTTWCTWGLPSIGLREVVLSDGPVGVRGTGENPDEGSECLPSPTALAACWDVALATRVGAWFAAQARAHNVDVVLAPVVNIQRSPVAGRHFEFLSEDPLLTGDIAVGLIEGMQRNGVAACVKHFVGNEVETDRTRYVSRIDERTMREVYLAPFLRAVEAGVWSVMAAYNRVDSGHEDSAMVAHRHLLVDVLKNEWGFAGPVISDWTAVTEMLAPALGGLDLVMPGPHSPWSNDALAQAVRRGDLPESLLDDKVSRLLWLAAHVGAIATAPVPEASREDAGDTDLPSQLAAQSCVVLTNQCDTLPLPDPDAVRSIALIGPNAVDTQLLGGGSASVVIKQPVSLAEGLAAAFPQASISLRQGVPSRLTPPPLELARTSAGVDVEFLDDGGRVINSQISQAWSGVFSDDIPPDAVTIHLATTVRLDEPGEHWLGIGTVGRHRIEVDGETVSESSHEVGGEIIINSSFNVPPAVGSSVTVTETRLIRLEAWVQVIDTQWGPRARAALYHRLPGPDDDQQILEACQAASACDLAIVVVGTNEETESEGWDRTDLNLPGRQNDLVDAVLACRPDAIVVVNAGAPVLLPWLDKAQTVLWAWLPGQAAGAALADILTGGQEPAGRLPWTLPASQADCPVPDGLPDGDGVIEYFEGLDVGYRGWAKSGRKPARPFGFGLGWTSWQLLHCGIVQQTNQAVQVSVKLRNTGSRSGDDLVQAYLRQPSDGPSRPAIWLAGYTRAQAGPGETVEAAITIPRRAFEVWDPADGDKPGRWMLPNGSYTIAIGHNSLDLPLGIEVLWA